MNITELMKRVRRGEKIIVEFTRNIEDFECCIDRGMRAVITKINNPDAYDCVEVFFDLKPFDLHNDRFAQNNYYDKLGVPCLTAKEAGMYPKSGIETVFYDMSLDIKEFIEIPQDIEN